MSLTASYISAVQFTVTGDYTADFVTNRKVRASCGVDGYKYTVVLSSSYGDPSTTVTLITDSDDLTSNLTAVDWSVVKPGSSGNIALHNHTDEDAGDLILREIKAEAVAGAQSRSLLMGQMMLRQFWLEQLSSWPVMVTRTAATSMSRITIVGYSTTTVQTFSPWP